MGGSSKSYSTIKSGSKASAYSIQDGRAIRTTEEDLLGGPYTFIELSDLAPGRCSAPHVAIIQASTCVGPTALVLPYVFLLGGFLSTFVLLPIFAFVACALRLRLVQLGISHGVYSLHGLAALAFGLAILFQDLPVLLAQALGLKLGSDNPSQYPTAVLFLKDRVRFAEIVVGL